MSEILPVWHPSACIPREEVLKGKLTDAELALRLSTIVKGEAKPPYNTPESFLNATHLTKNMKLIIENVFGRLAGTKGDVNPIIVLDVGFGGGKTHTMATLYYIAKYGHKPEISKKVGNLTVPKNLKIVTISGEDYTDEGIIQNGNQIKTIWGDVFWQLGEYEKYKTKDLAAIIPSIDEIKEAIKNSPTLILLDELPTYLKVVSTKKNMLDKTVQWIQRLVIAVSEVENAVLVVAIAEDVYKQEADKAKAAITEAVKEAMTETRAHIARKETVYVPVAEEDVVHILKKRLFDKINLSTAKQTAQEYHKLYNSLTVIDELKTNQYKDLIEEYYPFHPHLIKVLYERLATLDRFQRTRGALRLLTRTIRRIWNQKEEDATLIHPFHIDLADEDILTDLTTHIGEEKLRNAVEADIWKGDGTATAEQLDEQAIENWKAPLVRRACNTIYLYSLATGREGDRGIRSDALTSLLVTPARREHFMKVRDIVLDYLSDEFHYIDKQGERYIFIKEPTPIRVIDLLARDTTEGEALNIIREKLQNEVFKPMKDLKMEIAIEFFPLTPSKLEDTPTLQVAILNPNFYVLTDKTVPENVSQFLEYSDDHKQHLRKYKNSTFLLVASEDRLDPVKIVARKIHAARKVRDDPLRYQIPKERKTDIEQYLARQEKLLHDYIRSAFLNVIYYHRDGIKLYQVRDGSGYGSSATGHEMLKHILMRSIERLTDSLDPEYIRDYVWPKNRESLTTEELYEQFFIKPGVKIPTSKEVLTESIVNGLEQGLWAIYRNGKIYIKENVDAKNKPKIYIDSQTEILTIEEAKRRMEQLEKEEGGNGREEVPPPPPPPVTLIRLVDSKAQVLPTDLEKKMKTEQFKYVRSATIKTNIPDASLLQELRGILTRYLPERNLNIRLTGTLTRTKPPKYEITFETDKESSQREEGKSILENIWKLKGAESVDLQLELKWSTPTKPEELANILRTLKPDLIISLEAEVSKE